MKHESDDYTTVLLLTVDGVDCARMMQRGTREECEFVAENLPAVSHSGPEVVTDASVAVMPYQEYMRMVEPENDDE